MRITQRSTRPLLTADRPYEDFTLGWLSVIKHDGRWHMWYLSYDHTYKDDRDGFICYAGSKDGVNWEKPSLGLVEHNGSKDNNIIFAGSAAKGIHGHSVFLDPRAPANERFKMAYVDLVQNTEQPGWWVFGATSADGIHWNLIEKPILKYNSDSQVSCFRDGDVYRLYIRMWSGALFTSKRIIGCTQSSTFGDFPDPRPILSPDAQDPAELQFYNSAVSKLGDGLYVMFPSAFYTKIGTVIPHVAYSRDAVTFARPTHEPILPLGKSFDSTTVYVAPGAVPADKPSSYWFYYIGGTVKHDDVWPEKTRCNGGVGRFRLEVEGPPLVSLTAQSP